MKRPAAVFFDVDGTLIHANIVHYFVFLKTCRRGKLSRLAWLAGFLPRVPYYWVIDQLSRRLFNERFYGNYRGFSVDALQRGSHLLWNEFIQPRCYPEAIDCARAHRSRGHRVILVSGSLRPLLEPLARYLDVDHTCAAEMVQKEGVYTGELRNGALTGAQKALAVTTLIKQEGLDAEACFAYADSVDDLPMLESVGYPRVVNPAWRLQRIARRRNWEIVKWKRSSM